MQGGTTYQDNAIAYDALGRMRWVSDSSGGATLTIDYDKVGNRTHIRTQLSNADVNTLPSDTHRYFQYDEMNRQTLVDSSSVDGSTLGPKATGSSTTTTAVASRTRAKGFESSAMSMDNGPRRLGKLSRPTATMD